MHPSSPSADLFQMYLYGSASAEPFFVACFPGELGSTTAHLRRLPRKGRAGGAKDLCSSIACRVQPCQRCTPVLQALICFRCIFTALLRQSRFCFGQLEQAKRSESCAQKEHPRAFGPGCSAVIGNVRWKRKASFAAGSWPGSRSPGPMRRCGRRSARCAQRAARRIPGG